MKAKLGISRRSRDDEMREAKTFRTKLARHMTILPAAEIGMRF
jgi:hypothetical protein